MFIASPFEYFYVDNLVFIQVNPAKLKIFAFGSCLTYNHHSIVKDKRLLLHKWFLFVYRVEFRHHVHQTPKHLGEK